MHYYINNNAQPDSGDHEVHTQNCYWLSIAKSKQYLGYFLNCHEAIAEARKYYDDVDGCAYCTPACHKS